MTSSTIVATPTYTKVMLKARPARGWQDQNGDVFGGQVREAQIKTSAWTTAPDAGKIRQCFGRTGANYRQTVRSAVDYRSKATSTRSKAGWNAVIVVSLLVQFFAVVSAHDANDASAKSARQPPRAPSLRLDETRENGRKGFIEENELPPQLSFQ
jgi:hypothetical protein